MQRKKVVPILIDSYLKAIINSAGAKTWRNLYSKIDGQKKDITEHGQLSCAFFVSSILLIFKLINEMHATVDGTLADMKKQGWTKTAKIRPGCVLVWEKKEINGSLNRHIGFYIGDNKAVSNNFKTRQPEVHHYTFGTAKKKSFRKIEGKYWHKKLL